MPPFDTQKNQPGETLNRFAEAKIATALSLLAKSVPCSVDSVDETGTIVVVKIEMQQPDITFPMIRCPVYGPEYVRWPLKKGDKGVMFSADYYLGQMSGLGDGVADLTPQWNLSTGVFFPIGNTNFSATDDAKAVVLYGPDGTILRGGPPGDDSSTDPDPVGKFVVNADGVFAYGEGTNIGNYTVTDTEGFKVYIKGQLKFIVDGGGARFIGGPMGNGQNFGINVTPGGTFIDNVNFLPHQHVGVQTGPGQTGAVVTPP